MDRKKANDSLLVLTCLGVLAYGTFVAFPATVRATEAKCCGGSAGDCSGDTEWCKQGPCDSGALPSYGTCVSHAEGEG
jgi:hypothetical protein